MKVKYISKTDIECESTNFHSKRLKRLLPHLSSKNLANISGKGKLRVCRFHDCCTLVATVLLTGLLTACYVTGYGTQKHGMRYTATGYGTPLSRDVIHSFRGIRYTGFTGYDALEKSMNRLETVTQQGFQAVAKSD